MVAEEKDGTVNSKEQVLARVRSLTGEFRERAAAAEEARTLPQESIEALLAAGITRILVPPRFGGYGLSLDTWFEAVREIGKADASHAWCASLMIHHPHYISQFAEVAQKAVWADGLDVPIAASILPSALVTPAEGGYRIAGEFPFASGVNHSRWLIVGGMVEAGGHPEWTFFLVERNDFKIVDNWLTGAMRATGSNTVVCDAVFVPGSHTVPLSQLREGKGPGGALHANPIYRAPFISYAPLTFVTPMLGAAQGAYDSFRDWTKTRRGMGGVALAEITSIQVRLARAAADLDAAELLLRRVVDTAQAPTPPSLVLRARSMRDLSRASELCVAAIDSLIAMSGTAVFAASHPIQRAWRDIHFAAMHVSLNPELNFTHFGRSELGLPRDPHQPFF
jgi:3-hydroxy-9,10-secoandrosta-1,3,5(10)-triene-9,17-dione monooxygenase